MNKNISYFCLILMLFSSRISAKGFPPGSNLPVIFTPAAPGKSSDKFVLLFSGDGGWKTFDQDLCNAFAKRGIPVVAINSLKYFWSGKTPEQTTRDAQNLIQQYCLRLKKNKIILIGYSFGADVIPFIYNRIGDDYRKMIETVSMLSPGTGTDFEIHLSGMIDIKPGSSKYHVIPEVKKMEPLKPVCFFGREETNTAIQSFKNITKTVVLDGSHHYTEAGLESIVNTLS